MPDADMLAVWTRAFLLTLAIEAPLVLIGFARVGITKRIAIFFLANCLTHPALWFVFPRFDPYVIWLLLAETIVILVEWGVFAAAFRSTYSARYALLISFCVNFSSTLVGLIVYYLSITPQ